MSASAPVSRTTPPAAICTKHFGCDVHYNPDHGGCPACDSESMHAEYLRSNTMTLRIDEQSIPVIADNVAESLHEIAQVLTRLVGIAENLVTLAQRLAANEGIRESSDPICPKCSGEMQLKERRDGSGKFWSCFDYPKCTGTRQYFANVNSTPTPTPTGVSDATSIEGSEGPCVEF